MAVNEEAELDSLLDSALEDFSREAPPPRPAETLSSTTGLGQGLGKGLPPLERKPKKSKASQSNGVAATLEKLAEQTRNTVQQMDTAPTEEDIEKMAKQLESLGKEDIESIMKKFMQHILSKDILHEPMKEIAERYPPWLETNKSRLSKEDYERYSQQHKLIVQLCQVYDETPDDFQKIVDLMQHMQSCGQPPAELVEELAPGLQLGDDGLPILPGFAAGEADPSNCAMM